MEIISTNKVKYHHHNKEFRGQKTEKQKRLVIQLIIKYSFMLELPNIIIILILEKRREILNLVNNKLTIFDFFQKLFGKN